MTNPYTLSTDYAQLKALLDAGYEIIGFHSGSIHDTFNIHKVNSDYVISGRFERWSDSWDEFCECLKSSTMQFIPSTTWLPIDECPGDTPSLLRLLTGAVIAGYWYDEGFGDGKKWYAYTETGKRIDIKQPEIITRWMPLPAAPESE